MPSCTASWMGSPAPVGARRDPPPGCLAPISAPGVDPGIARPGFVVRAWFYGWRAGAGPYPVATPTVAAKRRPAAGGDAGVSGARCGPGNHAAALKRATTRRHHYAGCRPIREYGGCRHPGGRCVTRRPHAGGFRLRSSLAVAYPGPAGAKLAARLHRPHPDIGQGQWPGRNPGHSGRRHRPVSYPDCYGSGL